MKQYEFKIVVREGLDHFWDDFQGKSGVDEVTRFMREVIGENFTNCSVKLVKFEDVDPS